MDQRLAPGARFGKYEIVDLLGEGGMGLVYEARHVDLKKRVAIKTLTASLAALPEATARFRREGEAAARIRHPNVVDVTDVGVEAGVPYLVMEYLEGETLGSHLRRRGALPVVEIVDLALPIIAAIAAGHDVGVIHRDLKPSNIFLVRDRSRREITPKVLDFGVSKLADAQGSEQQALTRTGAHLGTICYMSPEQALGAKQVDARSDQYALGLILYECASGRRAYRDDEDNTFALLRRIGDNRFKPLNEVRPDLPAAFAEALTRALAHQASDRHASMSALGAALLPFGSARAVVVWERAFRRETATLMTAEPAEAVGPGTPKAAIDPTMVFGQTVALGAADAAGALPAVSPAGGTRLLPADPAASPEGRSASGLAFESISPSPAAGRPSRRSLVPVALLLLVGAVVVVFRTTGSPTARKSIGQPLPPRSGDQTSVLAGSAPPEVLVPAAGSPLPPPREAPPRRDPAPEAPPAGDATAVTPHRAPHHSHAHKSTGVPEKPTQPTPPRVGANNAKIME